MPIPGFEHAQSSITDIKLSFSQSETDTETPQFLCICSSLLCLCGLHCLFLPNLVNAVQVFYVTLRSNYRQPTACRGLFPLQSRMLQCVPSRQTYARETTMIHYTDFLFCGRRFIAAKTTERPLNSKTQPDRCGRETLPAAVEVIHPRETHRDGLLQNINSC